MDISTALLIVAASYLIGSFSFGRLVIRLFAPNIDMTRTKIGTSTKNEPVFGTAVGATTVSMQAGPRLGFATVVLDMLKITIPTLVVKTLFPGTAYYLVAATGGMIGHCWPIYYRFQGGRGLSAVYGGMFAVDWIGVFATALGGVIIGMFILRNIVLVYMCGLWLLIPWLWLRTHDLFHVAYAIVVNIIFVLAMIPEIKQLRRLSREGTLGDFSEHIQLTAMGRGLYRMAKRFGVMKDKAEGGEKPDQQA